MHKSDPDFKLHVPSNPGNTPSSSGNAASNQGNNPSQTQSSVTSDTQSSTSGSDMRESDSDSGTTSGNSTGSVQTGDTNQPVLWAVVMLAAAAVCAILIRKRKMYS